MEQTRDEFIQRLDESGVIELPRLQKMAKDIPAIRDTKTGQQLADLLVAEYRLTDYQACILLGKETGPLRLADYIVLDKVGEGGMGVVLKSKRPNSVDVVAIKLLPSELTDDVQAVLRFRREVELAAQLHHPNVVRAIEHGTHEHQQFFVMEYVDGIDIANQVKSRGPLSLLSAVDHMRDAARGLEYAHYAGVIHRDIKPANLLVNQAGKAKILDMGLARETNELASENTSNDLTRSGIVLGTADYMSPEQALNSKHADQRSDIYSLGCTFHFMLTGHPPYGGETAMEKLIAHREDKIPKLKACRDDIPDCVERIYQRMLKKDPKDRYQSSSELLADIEECRTEFGHMWMLRRFLKEQKGKHRSRGIVIDDKKDGSGSGRR